MWFHRPVLGISSCDDGKHLGNNFVFRKNRNNNDKYEKVNFCHQQVAFKGIRGYQYDSGISISFCDINMIR